MHGVVCARDTDEMVIVFNEIVDEGCLGSSGKATTVHIELDADFDCSCGLVL